MTYNRRDSMKELARGWALAALPALVITLGMPFAIILKPSLTTLLLTLLALFLSLIFFFYRLAVTSPPLKSWGFMATVTACLVFVVLFGTAYTQVQDKLLYGYKAVDDNLSPSLVNGDHYFGDKRLFRTSALKKGDIYVIRNKRGKIFAARLLYQAGDTIALNGKFRELRSGEYGFYSGRKTKPAVVVGMDSVLAKAVMIYWCFDPHNQSPMWERSGQVIR